MKARGEALVLDQSPRDLAGPRDKLATDFVKNRLPSGGGRMAPAGVAFDYFEAMIPRENNVQPHTRL